MTFAKKDIAAGEKLDGIGGFATYGLIELHSVMMQNNYLPIGLSEGCIAKKNISKDEPIKYDDVSIPEDSVLFDLRQRQDREIG
jgi:predicted homoserine dehydrogenase-like protein